MIDATYYDGMSSRRHPVTLIIHQRVLAMRGDGLRRNARLSAMQVSERLQHAPRILRFADGGFIEAHDHRGLDKMLSENRFRDPRVVRWQNNWPVSLLALVFLLALLLSGYQWGVPLAADTIAQNMSHSLEKRIGDQEWEMFERSMLTPSKLPAALQARLRARFMAMHQPRGERTSYRIEFRGSRVGPNAFALPNGVIVMTDELVALAGSDEAVLGVLSHELGHLQRRHSMRHVLQTAGVGIMLNLWVGDLSNALAAVPAILLQQKHSRDFEREADHYAIDMMQANKEPLAPMATLFERMSSRTGVRPALASHDAMDEEEQMDEDMAEAPQRDRQLPRTDYFSSHPSDAERIATLRAADRARAQ